jgi:two-component system, sensor histidine kinase and response regulator
MEFLLQRLHHLQLRLHGFESLQFIKWLRENFGTVFSQVLNIGITNALSDYQKRKLRVFNLINFMQIIAGTLIPVLGFASNPKLGVGGVFIACLPALVSILVFYLNHQLKYELALLFYFILYPVFTQFVYLNGINLGDELYFIFYGLLSVFLLKNVGYMLMSIAFSMVPYFILSVLVRDVQYSLANENKGVYIFNQAVAILFIFYGLYLIKREMTSYQFRILRKNRLLTTQNHQIELQRKKLEQQATQLQTKTDELTELNGLKNKLFSVISHDLKSPMYALRTLFNNAMQYNMPAKDVKKMLPEVLNDLNYTIGLMDNMLAWAKSQMQGHQINKQEIDVTKIIEEVIHVLRLPAEAKQISVEHQTEGPVYVYADKEMIHLVLRNLISNAIKFTPQCGTITVGATETGQFAEVFVQDSGMGISPDALKKINSNSFYTTKGTSSESGTGLGLMLCKEFLHKNGGRMHIESEVGSGSLFSFTLPVH